jgi:hypothetical protein
LKALPFLFSLLQLNHLSNGYRFRGQGQLMGQRWTATSKRTALRASLKDCPSIEQASAELDEAFDSNHRTSPRNRGYGIDTSRLEPIGLKIWEGFFLILRFEINQIKPLCPFQQRCVNAVGKRGEGEIQSLASFQA